MKIAFLLYPVAKVKVEEDSSFWIMYELKKRGHQVYYFESDALVWENGKAKADLCKAGLHEKKGFLPSPSVIVNVDLAQMDCIFIRKEPPFDNSYLHALQILELLRHKVFMMNDPSGIAICNEKLFNLQFTGLAPQSLVTESALKAKKFIKSVGRVVMKPLNDKGGRGIVSTHPKDQNLSSLLDIATHSGKEKVLLQQYLPHQRSGDKRILVLDGKAIGGFIRVPSTDDFRANLSVGGSMRQSALSPKDHRMVESLAPTLRRHGLHFVGLDVIGDFITEINVTSPSGIPEINFLSKTKLERIVVDFIEQRL